MRIFDNDIPHPHTSRPTLLLGHSNGFFFAFSCSGYICCALSSLPIRRLTTVNPEYFVCILISFIFYAAASVLKKKEYTIFFKFVRIEGQWLYEIFMHVKGRGSPAYENLVRTKNAGFAIVVAYIDAKRSRKPAKS